MNVVYNTWDTFRSADGKSRATYHPEWGGSQPWATYSHGTAGRHCATLSDAQRLLGPLPVFAAGSGLKPQTFRLEIHGPADKDGRVPYCLHWQRATPDGTGRLYRAQEFRADPEQTRANMRDAGFTEHKD